jgi:hypothetical protein
MVRPTAQPQVLKEWMALLHLPVSASSSNGAGTEGEFLAMDANLKAIVIWRLVGAWVSVCGASTLAKNADVRINYLQKATLLT